MPPEVQEEIVTSEVTTTKDEPKPLTVEEEAAADDDFAAGFNTAQGDEPHAETRPPEKTEEVDPEKKEEPAKPEVEDLEVPGLGMKASEVKAALARAGEVETTLRAELNTVRDSAMGRLGNLQQALDALKKNPATGQPKKVTIEQLKGIAGEFPELAELLASDLSSLVLEGQSGTVDMAAVEAAADARAQAKVDAMEQRLTLTARHHDWRQVKKTPEWTEWKATLPAEAVEILRTSTDGSELAEAFDDFKAWKANGKKAPEAAPSKSEAEIAEEKEKAKRIAANLQPRGNGNAATSALLSDDDAFTEGFKSIAGQRSP